MSGQNVVVNRGHRGMAPGCRRQVWKALLVRSWVHVFTRLLIHCEKFS